MNGKNPCRQPPSTAKAFAEMTLLDRLNKRVDSSKQLTADEFEVFFGDGGMAEHFASVASATQVARSAQHQPSTQQPEPAAFCSALELDGDPPPSQLTVRSVVTMVFGAALFCLLVGYATGCAPARSWSPATATIVLPPSSPACAAWAMETGWSYLHTGVPATVERKTVAGLGDGMILVDWRAPADPMTLATAQPFGDAKEWADSTGIVRGVVTMNRCDAFLAAHELAHLVGLPNVEAPDRLMSAVYRPDARRDLTRRERRRLERH